MGQITIEMNAVCDLIGQELHLILSDISLPSLMEVLSTTGLDWTKQMVFTHLFMRSTGNNVIIICLVEGFYP